MALNSFAHVYEEATIDCVRETVLNMLDKHIPPLRPDMAILDLAVRKSHSSVILVSISKKKLVDLEYHSAGLGP